MSKSLTVKPDPQLLALEKVLIQGDLSALNETQRLQYMRAVCKAIGISMLFRPFDFIKMNGKTVMYANRSCAEQLRMLHKMSIKITNRERVDGLYCVTAQAKTAKGKEDESIGAVNIKGLAGEALANALMKAETKAKRRVTLSIAGLGMLDEIEAKQVAEAEAKITTDIALGESETKLELTTERPEFEREAPQASSGAEPSKQEYVLKAGRLQGKRLSQVPVKKLEEWAAWYHGYVASGMPLNSDVQDDAFHIQARLDEMAMPPGAGA